MSKIVVADVSRAIVKTCMAHGIEDLKTILSKTAEAINGMGRMTVAAHKAWMTMDKQASIKNRKRINRNRNR